MFSPIHRAKEYSFINANNDLIFGFASERFCVAPYAHFT